MTIDDDALDALLRSDAADGPADAGFSDRVMAAVSTRRRAPAARIDPLPLRAAQWMALGGIVCALGWLWPELSEIWPREGRLGESLLTVAALLGLVTWWSLPQSKGSLLH